MTTTKTPSKVKPWARTLLIISAFFIVFALFQLLGYLVMGLNMSDISLQRLPYRKQSLPCSRL